MEVFLYNSTVCRLCGEENDNGTLLYSPEQNTQSLSDLINSYLPIKVSDDGQLPRTICPGCTIQLEATVEFLNLIINGQKIIRELHQREKQYQKSIQITPTEQEVITENMTYEVSSTNGVYQIDHQIALQVEGLEKPKRKRGRPPKKTKTPEELAKEDNVQHQQYHMVRQKEKETEPTGKRLRKTPTRFREAVQGKELERIFIEEGVIDGEDLEIKPEMPAETKTQIVKEPEVIGHLEESGELVVVVKGKGRGRPKGRMRPRRSQCAICGLEFSCAGRYMAHVAQHGRVRYQCAHCARTFPTRLQFAHHQRDQGHSGQNILPETSKDETTKETIDNITLSSQESIDMSVDKLMDSITSLPDLDSQESSTVKIESIKVQDIELKSENTVVEIPSIEQSDNGVEIINDSSENSKEEKTTPTGKAKLKCNHCDKMFSSRQSKSMHIKASHNGERPYLCGECGARFAYPRSLALHALSHRRARHRGYACDLCGKVLNHPSSVVYHKEAEHAGQRYVCNKCGKSFKHKQLLQRHQLVHSHHRPFSCKVCNTSFKAKANLMNHQLLHTGVKKFTCEICKQKFAHKTSLTLHLRWHTGQKPYTCNMCGKSFSQKGNLSEHARIHSGEKPYECAVCGRRFTTSSQHRLHARRHAALRPHACAHCGKRFATRSGWAAHMRREAGARPQACPACPRTFADRWALAKHTRTHTGERPFRCQHCPRAFADASNLNKHRKQVHKLISLLANQQVPEEDAEAGEGAEGEGAAPLVVQLEDDELEERVIYVAYDVDEADHRPAYRILDSDEVENDPNSELYPSELLLEEPASSPAHVPVTDEQGNPLHFTMQDGTRLAITSVDGHSLQVITHDGQTIPVEINTFAEEEEIENSDTIVHHLDL